MQEVSVGDDLDIANLIAEEVGGPVPEAAAAGGFSSNRPPSFRHVRICP